MAAAGEVEAGVLVHDRDEVRSLMWDLVGIVRTDERLAQAEPGPHRSLGVVLVGLWNPEGSEHGIAGELLDDAAVRGDALRDMLEEGRDPAADDLRVARRGFRLPPATAHD